MGCMIRVEGGGIDIAIMPETLVGRATSSGDDSSSMEPKSFSSFSISSSLLTGIGCPSGCDSWVRRCLLIVSQDQDMCFGYSLSKIVGSRKGFVAIGADVGTLLSMRPDVSGTRPCQ